MSRMKVRGWSDYRAAAAEQGRVTEYALRHLAYMTKPPFGAIGAYRCVVCGHGRRHAVHKAHTRRKA